MGLTKEQINLVERTIRNGLRSRFETYDPEPAEKPFHTRLLGRDRLALYAFIHSLNTSFGTTIFEPVAISLAKSRFKLARLQAKSGTKIGSDVQAEIQEIMNDLTTATAEPDKTKEIERIRKIVRSGGGHIRTVKLTKIDVYLQSHNDEIYFIDIKTAKPNMGSFKEFKRTLLEWVAAALTENPNAKINTLIAIPYNPYAPKPYSRWTMKGMLDLNNELKVAEEFWNFVGGEGAYDDLLCCFERVGIELRDEIDDHFKKFNIQSK